MSRANVGTLNGTGEVGNNLTMNPAGGRQGGPADYGGTTRGAQLTSAEHRLAAHYVEPTNNTLQTTLAAQAAAENDNAAKVPSYYNRSYGGLPVPYAGPSELKERLAMRSAIRSEANAEQLEAAGEGGNIVQRIDPISEDEIAYLKAMKDQTELAKFDDYVESYIDPRQPGNMQWLMSIYPDYVNRRLQQAHTDYEFALRNQMIDSWGINTFDDLHFKYLVDQGKIAGPRLERDRTPIDARFSPGYLSVFNFLSPNSDKSTLALPFASARTGARPATVGGWNVPRTGRPMSEGNTYNNLAKGIYRNPGRDAVAAGGRFAGGASGAPVGGVPPA